MISVPAILQNMQVLDCVRSGALVVAFLAVSLGNRKSSDGAAKWLNVDAVSSALFGLGFLIFPDILLGYMVYGKLDPVHTLLTRMFGVMLLSSACTSYYFARQSVNKAQRILTQSLVLLTLVMCMGMVQMKSAKGGKQRFNDQHLTFGILGCGLWFLGNFIHLFRASDLGEAASRPFSLRTRADLFAFLDMMICFVGGLQMFGFPSFSLSMVNVKGFKMDMVHAHMSRTLALSVFAGVLGYLQSFLSGSANDRQAAVSARVMQIILGLPVLVAYQWWFELYAVQFFTMYILTIYCPVCLLVGGAYYAGLKNKSN